MPVFFSSSVMLLLAFRLSYTVDTPTTLLISGRSAKVLCKIKIFTYILCDNLRAQNLIFDEKQRPLLGRVRYVNATWLKFRLSYLFTPFLMQK